MEENGYTGRKLNSYVWIPKSKTDLREFREIIKICYSLEQKTGYFSDKTLGAEMVSLRAIVDRDNTADSYIEKYQGKSIGNQSYTSNARMMLRILRWLGLVTKDYDPEKSGKFYLTPHGLKFVNFSGPFPSKYSNYDELKLYEEFFANLRFYSVNDDIRYRNYYFRQRFFYNMIKVLGELIFATHYELALSALVLRNDSDEEFSEKIGKIKECRYGKRNLRWLMHEYGLDCDNKSTLTGIYDGPKVLLSFAKQMGLVEEMSISDKTDESKKVLEIYSSMYSSSGHVTSKSIKKYTRITPKGLEFIKKFNRGIHVWYDEIKNAPEENAATIIVCCKNGFVELSKIRNLETLDKNLFHIDNERVVLNRRTNFDLYRDVPYEKRKRVIEVIQSMDENILKADVEAREVEGVLFLPRQIPEKRCLECSFQSCGMYRDKINAFGGRDRFASRVCPENIISFDETGILEIKESGCVGCGLCILNCSFDGIVYDENNVFHKANNTIDDPVQLGKESKKQKTLDLQKQFHDFKPKIDINDVPRLLDSFLKKINLPGKKWDKDKCYVYVRNVFKLFGVEAVYSGSGGMKTRSDITIESPFVAVSEVKSPAESPINMKAVRQAVDAAVQSETGLTMAIGIETHTGAIDQELKYRKTIKMGVLLLELQYLAFLVYVNEYFVFNPESLKFLISNYKGHFNEESLLDFLLKQKTSLSSEEIENLIKKSF